MPYYPDDWSAMQDAIYEWASSELGPGWQVVWTNEDAPRPVKPYALLTALDLPAPVGRVAYEAIETSPTSMTLRARQDGAFVLNVQLFSDNQDPRAQIERLRMGLNRPYPTRENLRAAGLTPGEIVGTADLSEIFSGRLEWRFSLDVLMGLEMRSDYANQPWIETVIAVPQFRDFIRATAARIAGGSSLSVAVAAALGSGDDIDGSASVAVAVAGAISGLAEISGMSSLSISTSLVNSGEVPVSGAAEIIAEAAAQLVGLGLVSAEAASLVSVAGAISGLGVVAGVSSADFVSQCTAIGVGLVAGSPSVVSAASAAVIGAGAVAGSSSMAATIAANVTGYASTHSLYHDGSGNANLGAMTSLNGATQAWISVWVRFDGAPVGNEWIVSSIQASNRQFGLFATGSSLRAYVHSTVSAASDYLQWNSVLPSSTWFHLLMQFDGTRVANEDRIDVYLNNADLGAISTSSGAIPAAMTSPGAPVFYLGVPDAQGINPAWIDNLSVGTGLLTSGDRAALYNGGTPPAVSALSLAGGTALHWWPIGELGDDASNLYDQIGNRDGTITGLPLQAEAPP